MNKYLSLTMQNAKIGLSCASLIQLKSCETLDHCHTIGQFLKVTKSQFLDLNVI